VRSATGLGHDLQRLELLPYVSYVVLPTFRETPPHLSRIPCVESPDKNSGLENDDSKLMDTDATTPPEERVPQGSNGEEEARHEQDPGKHTQG